MQVDLWWMLKWSELKQVCVRNTKFDTNSLKFFKFFFHANKEGAVFFAELSVNVNSTILNYQIDYWYVIVSTITFLPFPKFISIHVWFKREPSLNSSYKLCNKTVQENDIICQ